MEGAGGDVGRGDAGARGRARCCDRSPRGGRDLRLRGRRVPGQDGKQDASAGDGPRVLRYSSRDRRGSEREPRRPHGHGESALRRRDVPRVPAENTYPLPEELSDAARVGALAEPLANGVHAVSLGLARYDTVEHAVIIGAGTIGLMCLQAAALSGVENVQVVEPNEARREQALGLGARAAYSSAAEAWEALEEPTKGLGADLVIDAVGAEVTRRMATEELLRPGGRAVMIGLHDDDTTLGFHHVVRGQIDIQGSYTYTDKDFETAIGWLVEGRAGLGELPSVLPLERGPEAFAELVKGTSAQIKVFLAGAEE